MAAAVEANPLLDQKGLPKFKSIDPTHVVPGVEALAAELDSGFAQFEAELGGAASVTFESVVEKSEQLSARLGYAWGVVGHLNGVKNSDELRTAHATMQPKVVELVTKLGQSKAVYEALEQLDTAACSEAQQRIVEAQLRTMKLSGVGLAGAEKDRYNEIELELSKLATDFSNNVLDATKAFELELTEKSDVEGLPPSALAAAAQKHKSEAATAEEGPWLLGLDIPSYLPAMKYLKSSEIREKLYRAFVTRAGEVNAPLIDAILALKREKAQLLGYDSYSQVSLASKMAADVGAVDELHALLSAKALPAAKRDLAELEEYAAANGFEGQGLKHWDVSYWSEKLREEKFGFSEEELRPYFAMPAVLDGLFDLITRLFGVTIHAADSEAEVWNDDVRYFVVNDAETGARVASFFLDPYARPENKRGGAWMDVCVGKSKACARDVPTAYLTCNGSPPVGSKPSLMTFNEVTTLYHEMGHGLQHMLTKVQDGEAAGINGVEWDAVELPSQFMENWLLDKDTLYSFAKHYETGEPLPDHYFDKLKGAHTFQAGLAMSRQLSFGALDVELHRHAQATAETPFEVQRRVFETYSPMAPLPEDRFLCAFSHIFAGGYACGYYSYKWSEVMSADAFAAFEEAGLDDDEKVRAVGKKFRDTVLALGGGTHPLEVFKAFRGRAPTPDALLRHSGLA